MWKQCPHARDQHRGQFQKEQTGQRKVGSSKWRLKPGWPCKFELWQCMQARAGAPSTPPRGLEKEYSARITRSIKIEKQCTAKNNSMLQYFRELIGRYGHPRYNASQHM